MTLFRTIDELQAHLGEIRNSPQDHGRLEMIVIRPVENERMVLHECPLSAKLGVHGDFWATKCWSKLPDGTPNPDVQVTLMNSRFIDFIAGDCSRWPLAGDQLYVDLDLSVENLSAGQRLGIGSVILEITSVPHTGCGLFAERFGTAAAKFVNSPAGKQLHLRGIYAKVVQDGVVKTGDNIAKID
jgi:MOSC domain-containing protein YiiM